MKYYTTEEVAKMFGVHPETIRRHVRAGNLKCCKLNQRVFRFTQLQINDWIK